MLKQNNIEQNVVPGPVALSVLLLSVPVFLAHLYNELSTFSSKQVVSFLFPVASPFVNCQLHVFMPLFRLYFYQY